MLNCHLISFKRDRPELSRFFFSAPPFYTQPKTPPKNVCNQNHDTRAFLMLVSHSYHLYQNFM